MAKFNKTKTRRGSSSMARKDHAIVAGPGSDSMHRFHRTLTFPITKAAGDIGGGIKFVLNSLPAFADFTALYDRYTIEKADVTFVLQTEPGAAAVANAYWPTIMLAADYNDVTAPASYNAVLEYGNTELLQFTPNRMTITRTIVPRAAMATYRGVATAGYSLAPPGVAIDITSPDVEFYGFKYWISNYSTANTPSANVQVFVRYYLRMFSSR